MNSTPTKTYRRTSNLCCFCRINLGVTYGKIIPSVPVFQKSSNKEFKNDSLTLNDRLKIAFRESPSTISRASSCRKCARKIITTVENFIFIKNAVSKEPEKTDEITKRCLRSPGQREVKKTCTKVRQTRKSLDFCDAETEEKALQDSIQNLMNLPVEEEDASLVKVSLLLLICLR